MSPHSPPDTPVSSSLLRMLGEYLLKGTGCPLALPCVWMLHPSLKLAAHRMTGTERETWSVLRLLPPAPHTNASILSQLPHTSLYSESRNNNHHRHTPSIPPGKKYPEIGQMSHSHKPQLHPRCLPWSTLQPASIPGHSTWLRLLPALSSSPKETAMACQSAQVEQGWPRPGTQCQPQQTQQQPTSPNCIWAPLPSAQSETVFF